MPVQIPYKPRPHQGPIHAGIEAHRWSVAVCHRRFGKTVLAVNQLIKAACLCKKPRPRFYYIAPTYRQGKQVAWDYLKHFTAPIPDVLVNESELRINLPNDAQIQILGADNPDAMRGIYADGAVFDEYGLMAPNVFSEVMRPAFADRSGWALFMGTPNGKNQFYDVVQTAKSTKGWYLAVFKASETGVLSPEELGAARDVMTADEYAQEFECSFEAAVKGAIYTEELRVLRTEGRIRHVPVDPLLPVHTVWDLGVLPTLWFFQSLGGGEVRIVDYWEGTGTGGSGLPDAVQLLQSKRYTYGEHYAPHDIEVREFTSGRSRLEVAASLGIQFRLVPKVPIEDGIHAARMLFPRCWFDEVKTKAGVEALQHYRRDYNTRLNEFKATPVHDWASHAADAFRYLALVQGHVEPVRTRRRYEPSYSGGPHGWML
jgi:hypothetical protein